MNAIANAVFLLLSSSSVTTCYKVNGRPSALGDRNDISNLASSSSGNVPGVPKDDPDLQNSLQRVMHDMNKQLNRTPYNTVDEDGLTTTEKLKLFFVSPSPDLPARRGPHEGAGISNYPDVECGIASGQNSRQIRGGDFPDTTGDQIQENKGTNHGSIYTQSVTRNETHTPLRNDSHSDDKVEMKVELTINLSESDQHSHIHSGNHTGITPQKMSTIFDHIHVSGREDETQPSTAKCDQNSKESDSVMKLAAGKVNLNIKVKSPNLTDTMEYNVTGNTSGKEGYPKIPQKQGAARSLNAGEEKKNIILEDSRNKSHITKKHVDNSEYSMMDNSKYINSNYSDNVKLLNITSRRIDHTERVGRTDDNGQLKTQMPLFEKSETPPFSKEPSTTESILYRQEQHDGNETESSLSDALKTMIQNLTKYYSNRNTDHSQGGDSVIPDISKFLPGNGGTAEEQNYLDQLRKYLSQPNLIGKMGFPDVENLTDFEAFLKILKKLSRSKAVKESGYYPIISEYLNFYDVLKAEMKSLEENSSEEESWSYESSLIGSLLDYLFDDESETGNGNKGKSKSHKGNSQHSKESESEEWDLL